MQRKSAFSRRLPDLVTEEIVTVLIENKKKAPLAWGVIFELIHERLKKRNAASGGEEMLRLRGYEKLKNLVDQNLVEKIGGKVPGQAKFKAKANIANALATIDPIPKAPVAEVKNEKTAVKNIAKASPRKSATEKKPKAKASASKVAPVASKKISKPVVKKVVVTKKKTALKATKKVR
jgi:hypothetical protein